MKESIVVCLLGLTLLEWGEGNALNIFHWRDENGMMGAPPHNIGDDPLPPDQWFTQFLDHYDPTNNKTWQQRYQVVTDYFVAGGPVFVMLGGEGAANAAWMVKGNWVNYAKQYKALMFQIEHRFYGKSHPTSDLSIDNLRFLSSEQALADIAYFVTGMNDLYNLTDANKWIAFGGSYSGNLAAWVRFMYPHLIHGAMSASGPVLAKVDFSEYMDVVRESLRTYNQCTKAIWHVNYKINRLLKTDTGREFIRSSLRLCDPIDITNENDIHNLLETIADNVAGIVQYNKDNRSFRSSTWNITIDTMCSMLLNMSQSRSPLLRYATFNSLLLDTRKETCLDFKYDQMIDLLRNTSWDGIGAAYGARQWIYQTCTEFGYYQTSEKKEDLFKIDFPLSFFLKQCSDIYGDDFTPERVSLGVYRTNTLYGGLNNKATRVVYVHGSIDPWHALGITYTRIPESPAIYINGTAHCANMYPPADTDLPALQDARKQVGELIGEWLLLDS